MMILFVECSSAHAQIRLNSCYAALQTKHPQSANKALSKYSPSNKKTPKLLEHALSHASSEPEHPNQFALLGQRRFAPFFWTLFLTAGNDNLFKFAFTVMVTYQLQVSWLAPAQAGLVIGAVFILPFLLFSATSGQLTDKYDKSRMVRVVKNLEIGIMALAAYGFWTANVPVLLLCTFLMGLHSTLFGLVKYAHLPQALSERELTGGNGMVEMGTFVAILLGNVLGGILVAIPEVGREYVAIGCVAFALIGRALAQWVPAAPATDATLKINWNPFTETYKNLQLAHGNIVVFRSLLGISWMWFFGAVFLSQFPSFAKDVLHGNEQVASLLLVVFSVGIGVGSLLCETLSRRHVEIGLVPLGAIGMSVFSIDLYFASRGLPAPLAPYTLSAFVGLSAHWRVMADLALLSLFAGLYSVPMYALIQLRAQPTHRARIIAANNILNALFMIASSILAGILLKSGATIPQVFLATGIANAFVAFYIFMLVPEYFLRFVAWVASRFVYRFKVRGDQHIPVQGAAVLVCNHVSFIDAVLLMAASPRPIRFVMDHRIFKVPVLGWMFKLAKAIPIASQKEDPAAYAAAFEAVDKVLKEGDLLCIFPEGGITRDGQLQEFKGGIMKILERTPAPVIPLALQNLWGSFFSRAHKGEAMVRPFRRGLFSRVGLTAGSAISPAEVTPALLREKVQLLLNS
jgi:1-acyl-sn-glycerol-3-phosphate acyltransferase